MNKKVSGYVSSRHIFGRSILGRNGNHMYYLQWQWNNSKTIDDLIILTPKQYNYIKNILLESKKQTIKELTNISNMIIYYHKTSSKSYMRVKRYLIKQRLLKEA